MRFLWTRDPNVGSLFTDAVVVFRHHEARHIYPMAFH